MDTPAWMQVVERRREQAAEVIEQHLKQAAEDARSRPESSPAAIYGQEVLYAARGHAYRT